MQAESDTQPQQKLILSMPRYREVKKEQYFNIAWFLKFKILLID